MEVYVPVTLKNPERFGSLQDQLSEIKRLEALTQTHVTATIAEAPLFVHTPLMLDSTLVIVVPFQNGVT